MRIFLHSGTPRERKCADDGIRADERGEVMIAERKTWACIFGDFGVGVSFDFFDYMHVPPGTIDT